jgi:hypothetical protein
MAITTIQLTKVEIPTLLYYYYSKADVQIVFRSTSVKLQILHVKSKVNFLRCALVVNNFCLRDCLISAATKP